jgi:GrpB-like predicted nucleotidyltransferase (UPF0157 family)
MLGLPRGRVLLVPHDEVWHQLFREEKERILDAANDRSLAVEHIGSTAVCGISAKPILDIMVGIPEFLPQLPFSEALGKLGYEFKGENGIPERHYFGKGEPRCVHLNVVRFGGEFWLSHIAFRDYLKQSRSAAREYEQLKLSLAEHFPNDRESYTNGKVEFIERILAVAYRKSI